MTTTDTVRTSRWKRGLSRRLRNLADKLHDDVTLADAFEPGIPIPRLVLPEILAEGETEAGARVAMLRALIAEMYPTVAQKVLALIDGGDDSVEDWIVVARLLYDAHMHKVGGPTTEARLRALVATMAVAVDAQARSSARLAGYHREELDNPSGMDGDPAGMLVWEHYLCPEGRLARAAIHGEAVGDWLGSLGELWAAANAVSEPEGDATSDATHRATHGATHGATHRATGEDSYVRLKIALTKVSELALW